MKISAIQNPDFGHLYYRKTSSNKPRFVTQDKNCADIRQVYYPPVNISFGIANSGDLRKLFSHGLPSIYSDIEMIDPKKVQKLIKNKTFNKPAVEVFPSLANFEKSLRDIEEKVFYLIKEAAYENPDKTVNEVLQAILPVHKRRLKKKQKQIFDELSKLSQSLPDYHRYKFNQFLQIAIDKVDDKPVLEPFSVVDFRYKLEKIRNDVEKLNNNKALGAINRMIIESEKFEPKTSFSNKERQKNVLTFIEKIFKRSALKQNEKLKQILKNAKAQLNDQRIIVPFNRKPFIYDLTRLIDDIDDNSLKEEMIFTAMKLPTSRNSCAAYITKFSRESSEKIIFRLLWPFMASVEHLLPKSCGGPDLMRNFAGATTRENSDRSNIDFYLYIQDKPQVAECCQRYVDRLIELAKKRVFKKENIDLGYIEDFKRTIQTLSRNKIILDTSDLYK